MTPRQVADVGAQMADALSYVHGAAIVHRDVKPENILVADAPTLGYTLMAKLADFGVAQFIDGSRLTSDGAIMGTAAYISPEQARGEEVGTPSDVYSLGLVLLEALRGEREYTGSAIEAALARLHRPPQHPRRPARAVAGAARGDDGRRSRRASTAHDVAATMRDIIRGMIITGSRQARGATCECDGHRRGRAPQPRTSPQRGRRGSPRRSAIFGIAVALAVGAATGLIAR